MQHDRRTHQTYDVIAARYLERSRDRAMLRPWMSMFAERVAAGSRVVDLGAGPCLDSVELRALGLSVTSIDRSWSMLNVTRDQAPGPRVQADIRQLPLGSGCLAGAWACASLLHLDRADFIPALVEIRRVLIPGGILFLAVKGGTGEGWDSSKDGADNPRWFTYWPQDDLDAALGTAGFEIVRAATEPEPPNTWLMRLARV